MAPKSDEKPVELMAGKSALYLYLCYTYSVFNMKSQ